MNPEPGIILRHSVVDDVADLAGIYNTYILRRGHTLDVSPIPVGYFTTAIFDNSLSTIVATSSGEIVGWGRLFRWSPKTGYSTTAETSVYVHPMWIGQGVGRALKEQLIEEALCNGIHHLVARIFASNRAAIEYNLRLGYRMVGVQKQVGRVDGEFVDIAILERII